MKLKYIFGLIIILKCVFLGFPEFHMTPFPFAKGDMVEISAFTYVWELLDIASLAVVMLLMRQIVNGKIKVKNENEVAISAYMIICFFDLADFILRGNSQWFWLGTYPVTNNVFMVLLYWFLVEMRPVKHDID